jgi:N-acetylglucosamine malate deacetylase 1
MLQLITLVRARYLPLIITIVLIITLTGKPTMADQPQRTILAIGAHCGDMEVTCAGVLAKHAKQGDRVVLLHLTLGEGGNPGMSPRAYGEQKHREALEAARVIGAEVIFGSFRDGELPNDEQARRYVAEVIRQVKPTHIITHWKNSIHQDHANTYAIVMDAILLASLEGVVTEHPRHRGIRSIVFAENWEDPEGFTPYLYVDVSGEMETWKECVTKYEFIRGGISTFPYLDYYESLARVRGALAGRTHAVAFDVDAFEKKRVLDTLP